MQTFYVMVFLVLTANGPSPSGNAFFTNPLFQTEEACLAGVAESYAHLAKEGGDISEQVAIVCAAAVNPEAGGT